MKTVCSYCQESLSFAARAGDAETDLISHGICRSCLEQVMAGSGQPMDEFLNQLPAPVFAVAAGGCMVAANRPALELVGKSSGEVSSCLGGEVFGCLYADDPGGCGQTLHCQSCVIRATVMQTFESGRAQFRVPACQDLDTVAGPRRINVLITTEKAGEGVLLRIDEVQP